MGDALQRREASGRLVAKQVSAKSAPAASAAQPRPVAVRETTARPALQVAPASESPVARPAAQQARPPSSRAPATARLDILPKAINGIAQPSVQPRATPAPRMQAYIDEGGFDVRDIVLLYGGNNNLTLLAAVVLCAFMIWAFVGTPLGSPLGLYHGPQSWSGWLQHTLTTTKPSAGQQAYVASGSTADGSSSVVGPPTISPEQIDRVLESYGSPAAGSGQAFYDMGVKYGIDPAFALAFFIHESSAGTNPAWAGWKSDGTTTHNIGNIICAGYSRCYNRFRDYDDWAEGIEDWYRLIDSEYVGGRGVNTVEQIIPIYAPSFENDVPAYVQAVTGLVNEWRGQSTR
jgi:hypothetical protein